jgi:hypothetical protein
MIPLLFAAKRRGLVTMASWYRSSEMEYVQLYVQPTAAASVVDTLGSDGEGIIEFVDVSVAINGSHSPLLASGHCGRCCKLRVYSLWFGSCGAMTAFMTVEGFCGILACS